jgi:hypothetical protein
MTKVRTSRVRVYKDNSIHEKKSRWLRNGVAIGTTYNLARFWQLWTKIHNLKLEPPKFLKFV